MGKRVLEGVALKMGVWIELEMILEAEGEVGVAVEVGVDEEA